MQIVEKVVGQPEEHQLDRQDAASSTAGVTALPLHLAPTRFGRASVAGTSTNTFAGKGSTETTNDFSGTITATVTEVLPNGHLVIAGEKQIGVNHNVDVLRFSGQVDPRAIQPGNSSPRRRSPTCASSTAAAARRPRRRELAGWRASF